MVGSGGVVVIITPGVHRLAECHSCRHSAALPVCTAQGQGDEVMVLVRHCELASTLKSLNTACVVMIYKGICNIFHICRLTYRCLCFPCIF